MDQLYSAIVNGEASTSDLDGVADISLLWSAIVLIVRSTELLMYQRSSIEPSELAVHIQRFIGALFSTFENLLEHQPSCTTYLVQSMIQSCCFNNSSFNEKQSESELILVQMMSEYRSLFPYAYMFNRRTGKSPPSQIDKVTECFHRSDPLVAAANSYEDAASPSEPTGRIDSIGSHQDVVSDSNSELGDSFDNFGTFLAPMISAPSIMPLKPVKMLSDDEHYGSDYQPAAASDIDSDVYDMRSNCYRDGSASNEEDGSPASGDGAAQESGMSILSSYYKFSGWNTMIEEDEDSDTQDGSGGDYRPPAAHPSRSRRVTRMRSTAGSRKSALSKAAAEQSNPDEVYSDGTARSHTTRIKRSKRKKTLGTSPIDATLSALSASMANSLDQPMSIAAAAVESTVMDVQPFDSILPIQDLNMSDMDDARDISISEALVVETLSDDDEHVQRVRVRTSASHRTAAMVVVAPASLPISNSSLSQQRDHRNDPPIGLQTRWSNASSVGLEDSARQRPHVNSANDTIRTRSGTNADAPVAPGSSRASKPRIKFRNPLDASLELDNSVEEFTGSNGPDDNDYTPGRKESDLNLSLSETDTDPESYPSSYGGRIDNSFGSPMKHAVHSKHRRDISAVETAHSTEASVDDPPADTTQHGKATVVRVPTASPPRRPKYDTASNRDSFATAENNDNKYDPPSTGPSTNVVSDDATAGHTAAVHAGAMADSVQEEKEEEAQRRRERLQKVRAWITKRGELKQSSLIVPSSSAPHPESAVLDEPSHSRRVAHGSDAGSGTIRKSVSFRDDVVAASGEDSSFSPDRSRDSASSCDAVLHGSRNASSTSKASCTDADESGKSSEKNLEEEEEEEVAVQVVSSDRSDSILALVPGPSLKKGNDKHRNDNNPIDHHSDAVHAGGSYDLPHQYNNNKLGMDKPFSFLPSACKLPELSEFAEATGVIMEGFLQKKSSGVLGRMMLWRQVSRVRL